MEVNNKEAQSILERIRLGNELSNLRKRRKATLLEVADKMGVSANYISEIERGLKVPSDKMIRQIAEYYEYDEKILFTRFGKIPLSTREILEEMPSINELIEEIGKNNKLEDKKKEEILNELLFFARRLVNNAEKGGQ